MKGLTPKQFIAKLDRFQKGLSFETKEIKECIYDAHADYVRRIFINGRDANLSRIGQYSTKDMLVGRKTFRGLKSEYKFDKDSQWVTVNTRKGNRRLAVLKGGYKEFRSIVGRRTDTVDLKLRGMLYTDVANGIPREIKPGQQVNKYKMYKNGKYILYNGVSNDENAKKIEGHVKRYGVETFKADKLMLRNLGKCLAYNSVKLLIK